MRNLDWTYSYVTGVVDLADEEKAFTILADCPYALRDMEFDDSRGVLWAIAEGGDYTGALAQVDMETGAVYIVGDSGISLVAMTADAEGGLYAIGENGNLYKLNPDTGKATMVGATGVTANGYQSMHCDRNSGNTYWAQFENDNYTYASALYLVDLRTGSVTSLGTVGDGAQVNALYTVPETEPAIPDTLAPTAVRMETRAAAFVGGTIQLTAKVLPVSIASVNQTLTWSSSDEGVATVDSDGVVTGVAPGTAEITAAAVNGVSASCKVTVTGEERIFYAYDETNRGWISFPGDDTAAVTVERADAEGEDPILAAALAGETLYAYDSSGRFYTVDPDTFARTEIGTGIRGMTATVQQYSWETGGYTPVELPLSAVALSYDEATDSLYLAAQAADRNAYLFQSVIGKVNPEDGSLTEIVEVGNSQPANLLVRNRIAWFVDTGVSSLCRLDLDDSEPTVQFGSPVNGYWGSYLYGRSLIEDPLTGTVYAIRDLYGSDSTLYSMELSNAGLTPVGRIGSGVIVNSLFLR